MAHIDRQNLAARSTVQRLGIVKRLRGGLVFKAHRLVYHSTLGWRVVKKKKFIGTGGKERGEERAT